VNTLEHDDYLAMRAGATVLEADSFGEKVLRLTDGTVLKLFRRKRLFSSAAWYPYARRFADNAAALDRLGIPVPQIIGVVRIPSLAREAVHYHPLGDRRSLALCDSFPCSRSGALPSVGREDFTGRGSKKIRNRSSELLLRVL
jgi:hypothetical protein